MTGPRPDEVVHQVFFGWSHDTAEHTILASSLDETFERQWRARLRDHVRLQPVSDTPLPDAALSCIEFEDGPVAIVRRVPRGYSNGRGNTHVLIGSATALNASLALRLDLWNGWMVDAPPGGLGTIKASFLVDSASPAERPLAQVKPLESALATVITRLLDKPADPLSIIGCPEDYRLPLVWGLRAAADGYLEKQFGQKRRWTFSTYEDRHAASIENLPEIVFLPAVPGTGETHRRTVVRLDQPPDDSSHTLVAGQLVASLLRGAPAPMVTPGPPVGAGARSEQPDGALPVQRDVVSLSARHHASEGAARKQPSRRRAQNAREVLVEPLLAVESVEQLQVRLHTLSKHQDRAQVREEFDIRVVDQVAEFVEIDTRRELLLKLLYAVYGHGFEDLRDHDAEDHAKNLVKNSRSEQLALMLAAGAANLHRREIADAAFERWIQVGGQLRPIPKRRAANALSWVRVRRRRFVAIAATGLVLLAAVFVFGYLAGRPRQSAVVTGSQTSATPTSPSTPVATTTAAGTVTIPSGPGELVFAFVVQNDQIYFPQQECTGGKNASWTCERLPDRQRLSGKLVAVVVPTTSLGTLSDAANARRSATKEQGWREPVPVPES